MGTTGEGGRSTALKDAATIIPIVHLLAACFFIYSYCFGFGNRLVVFVTISDVFIVSLRVMGQIYILVGLPILIVMLVHFWKRNWVAFIVCALAAVASIWIMWSILNQSITPRSLTERTWQEFLSALAIGLLLLLFLGLIFRRSRSVNIFEPSALDVMGTILFTFVLAFAFGYNKGVTDRTRNYAESVSSYFRCGNGRVIIRPIGAHFLSLGPGNHWAMVDGECAVKFLIMDGRDARTSVHASGGGAPDARQPGS